MKRGLNITLLSAVITIGALAIPCVSWFAVGYRDAMRRATEIEDLQWRAARDAALQLTDRVRTRLDLLLDAESKRPFYQYQNLYHDPRGASQGASVVPSPLAEGPTDPWVWSYFQIDANGKLTLPSFNEEVREANQAGDVAGQRVIQQQLRSVAPAFVSFVRDGIRPLVVVSPQPVKWADKTKSSKSRSRVFSSSDENEGVSSQPQQSRQEQQAKVEVLDSSAYEQNVQATKVYTDIKSGSKGATRQQLDKLANTKKKDVVIPVGTFQWLTVSLNNAPVLVALREVKTPDQSLVQGFAIALDVVAESLKGAAFPAQFTARAASGDGEIGMLVADTHWRVLVNASEAIHTAQAEGRGVWRRFWVSFVWGVVSAFVAMLCVVGMVWQTERLARQRSQFAASAAHELRTPLAGLRMYSEMLAEGLGDPTRAKEYARRVADEAERLGRVVGNVLEFTRLERGTLKVRPEIGDLTQAVRECVARQLPALEAMGAKVETKIANELPQVRFDADAVGEILQNLLDNAEKHTRAASNRTIHVSLSSAANGMALSVADHGPGVASEIRQKLFRPFERGNHEDAPAGLGLGLVLVQALALAHGGNVSYADSPGGGAVFTVTFPA